MSFSKTIIISPSGNFYGSEQVLFDFLTSSKKSYLVFAPVQGLLVKKLQAQSKHRVRPFSGIRFLYAKIFTLLVFQKADGVYCNEGGHIRYIKFLARLFRKAKFTIHIRIIEDTLSARIGNLPSNVSLIAISRYVAGFLPQLSKVQLKTIHDPYLMHNHKTKFQGVSVNKIRAGIIGRVTQTKGLEEVALFCDFLENNSLGNIELYFFGDVETGNNGVSMFLEKAKSFKHLKVKFEGFVNDKNSIYSSVDLVAHFSRVEPLGRIFFESLDYGIPFIGFNQGGIGEIAGILSLENCMVDFQDGWENQLYDRMINVNASLGKYENARENLAHRFSPKDYCESVEEEIKTA